jgi:hypothetical protein
VRRVLQEYDGRKLPGGLGAWVKLYNVNGYAIKGMIRLGYIEKIKNLSGAYNWTGPENGLLKEESENLIIATRDAQEWRMTIKRKGENRDGISPQLANRIRGRIQAMERTKQSLEEDIQELRKLLV